MLRRIGVTLFCILTFLAQIPMNGQIAVLAKARPSVISRRFYRGLSAICLALLLLGSMSLLLPVFYVDYESIKDSFEWLLTLLIMTHFLVTCIAWKGTGFRASFAVSNDMREQCPHTRSLSHLKR